MKMIMKKKNVIEINSILNKLKDFGSTKFKYNLLKNLDLLKSQLNILTSIEEDIKKELTEFESDRNAVIMQLGTDTGNGQVSIDPSNTEVVEEFNSKLKELFEKHQESINNYNKKITEYQDILNEDLEEDIVFRATDIEFFPEEGITTEELEKLLQFSIIK